MRIVILLTIFSFTFTAIVHSVTYEEQKECQDAFLVSTDIKTDKKLRLSADMCRIDPKSMKNCASYILSQRKRFNNELYDLIGICSTFATQSKSWDEDFNTCMKIFDNHTYNYNECIGKDTEECEMITRINICRNLNNIEVFNNCVQDSGSGFHANTVRDCIESDEKFKRNNCNNNCNNGALGITQVSSLGDVFK